MNSQSSPVHDAGERDVIVYVPGLGSGVIDQSVDAISRRICCALNRYAASGKTRFVLQEGQDEDFADGRRTRLRTVVRQDPEGGGTPIVDIYELKYGDTLTRRLDEISPMGRILSLARVVAADVAKLAASFRRKGKSLPQKLQLCLLALVMLLVTAYGVVLLGGTLGAATQIWSAAGDTPNRSAALPPRSTAADVPASALSQGAGQLPSTPAVRGGEVTVPGGEQVPEPKVDDANLPVSEDLPLGKWGQWAQWIVVFVAALTGLTRKQVKDMLGSAAGQYVCARDYLALAERKAAIVGQLSELLEHVAEKPVAYRRVHLVSYSFGSIVALDAVFPNIPPGRRFAQIDTLVTIGCPFDLVRTYWPTYFKGRMKPPDAPKAWFNIYSPLDVLGSNFRDDQKHADAGVGVEIVERVDRRGDPVMPVNLRFGRGVDLPDLALADLVFMVGLRAHTSYLGDPEGVSISCFDLLVPRLFDV